jgi:transcriptional regulator with XRE-family HTH domain
MTRRRINRRLLKELRVARAWTLRDAATRMGITHQALDFMERGLVRYPRPETFDKIARAYDVDVTEIAREVVV